MRAELIGHSQPCMTDIDLHIDARTAGSIRTHPYAVLRRAAQEVVERCVATATWCADVDITAANAQVLCLAAGGADVACVFTAGTPATCVAVQEASCNNAVLGATTCAAAGGPGTKSCAYVAYVAPVRLQPCTTAFTLQLLFVMCAHYVHAGDGGMCGDGSDGLRGGGHHRAGRPRQPRVVRGRRVRLAFLRQLRMFPRILLC